MKEVLGENCPPTDTQNRYLSPGKSSLTGTASVYRLSSLWEPIRTRATVWSSGLL